MTLWDSRSRETGRAGHQEGKEIDHEGGSASCLNPGHFKFKVYCLRLINKNTHSNQCENTSAPFPQAARGLSFELRPCCSQCTNLVGKCCFPVLSWLSLLDLKPLRAPLTSARIWAVRICAEVCSHVLMCFISSASYVLAGCFPKWWSCTVFQETITHKHNHHRTHHMQYFCNWDHHS